METFTDKYGPANINRLNERLGIFEGRLLTLRELTEGTSRYLKDRYKFQNNPNPLIQEWWTSILNLLSGFEDSTTTLIAAVNSARIDIEGVDDYGHRWTPQFDHSSRRFHPP